MLNILTDPLIRMNVVGSVYPASLPETYAALMDDKVDSFPALRAPSASRLARISGAVGCNGNAPSRAG